MLTDIPQELTSLDQWICWRYVKVAKKKPTKVPFSPHVGTMASVTNVATWTSFAEASSCLDDYDGLGFVLTDKDPYCFFDFDKPSSNVILKNQIKIADECNSYAEISPSGDGLHIIIKAIIPSGCHKNNIGLFCTARYMCMTGNVYKKYPIVYKQEIASTVWETLQGKSSNFKSNGKLDEKEKYTDEQVVETASTADNSSKFCKLWMGDWSEYPSQSEADLALIDIIGYYTRNRTQITRLFLASGLGKREKVRKRPKYVADMVAKSFDNYVPPLDLEAAINKLNLVVVETEVKSVDRTKNAPLFIPKVPVDITPAKEPTSLDDTPYKVPTGLMGRIAQFFYNTSTLPVPEMAITASIAVMAGICGRGYNISGAGLNQYLLLLAETGTGKEEMAKGISKLFEATKMQVPAIEEFLGPAEFSSGSALLHHLVERSPCFLSICGEFGVRLQQISSPRAPDHLKGLKRVLLDLYSKANKDSVLQGIVYADKSKNISSIQSPSLTLLGESVPSEFYNAIDESTITGGLLPRFTIIEYNGPRVPLNENHVNVKPSIDLIKDFGQLAANALTLMKNKDTIEIKYPIQFFRDWEEVCRNHVNKSTIGVVRQLWSRAHLKSLKLAALVAVGNKINFPEVNLIDAEWAVAIIKQDILKVSERFFSGEMTGEESHEHVQIARVEDLCVLYLTTSFERVKAYGVPSAMYRDRILPYSYFSRKLISSKVFRKDRIGASSSIRRAVQNLVDNQDLAEVSKIDLMAKYQYHGRAYILRNTDLLAKVREKNAG